MNISEVNAYSSQRSDIHRKDRIGNSETVDTSTKDAASLESRDAGDRVEISDSARSASKDVRRAEELTFARKALDDVPTLSEERISELMSRIKSGFYQQPDVVEQLAKRAGGELASGGV